MCLYITISLNKRDRKALTFEYILKNKEKKQVN